MHGPHPAGADEVNELERRDTSFEQRGRRCGRHRVFVCVGRRAAPGAESIDHAQHFIAVLNDVELVMDRRDNFPMRIDHERDAHCAFENWPQTPYARAIVFDVSPIIGNGVFSDCANMHCVS